jgi:methionine aminotransferase
MTINSEIDMLPYLARTPSVISRLPDVGTTVFSVMSALAQQHGAVNLGQGFPDFECDPTLIEAVHQAMRDGLNQYPPMPGVPVLRQRISDKIAALHTHRYDPDSEITVTAGATQALLTAVLALVHPGDEVIVLEPCYDSYGPAIELAGAKAIRVPLTTPGFRPDLPAIAAALTARTRALIINTPHNPTGTVWTVAEREQLATLLRATDVIVIADEVYEHMVFDGRQQVSVSGHPELAARSLLISSFGKTFHVTGWKVGYAAGPASLMAEFRKVHQFNVFTVNTPTQHGLAAYLADPAHYLDLSAFYQRKRDRFRHGLAQTGLTLLPCEGTYFQCVNYAGLAGAPGQMDDLSFCRWLTETLGVAAIPMSAFRGQADEQRVVRLCFAKQDKTLDAALQRLQQL